MLFYITVPVLSLVVLVFFALGLTNFTYAFPWFLIQREYVYSVLFIAFAWCLSRTKLTFVIDPMVHVGKLSFSLYLMHPVIIEAAYYFASAWGLNEGGNWFSFFVVFVLSMVAGTILSTFTYRIIERRGIALGEKIIDKIRRRNYNAQQLSGELNSRGHAA